MMKIVSWNVNGIRAISSKNGFSWIKDIDFLGIQETKASLENLPKEIFDLGFKNIESNSAKKAGYSGVLSAFNENFSTTKSLFNDDDEGRVLEHRFKNLAIFNIYFPNGQKDENRLSYKMDFYEKFLNYIKNLKNSGVSVIFMGDLNTAHNEIDIKNPKQNENRSGFLKIEREFLDEICKSGFVDTFRHLYPQTQKFSWWSYRFNARAKNIGWRIDYIFVSDDLICDVKDAFIMDEITGSDHCPVGININLKKFFT